MFAQTSQMWPLTPEVGNNHQQLKSLGFNKPINVYFLEAGLFFENEFKGF